MRKIIDIIKEEIESVDDFYEILFNKPYEIFSRILNKEKIRYKVIPKNQYQRALNEFIKYKDFFRFPTNKILEWKEIVLENIALLNCLTEIGGHAMGFPYEEFYDVFDGGYDRNGDFSEWKKQKYEETKDEDYLREYDYEVFSEYLYDVIDIDEYLPLFSNGQYMLSDYGLDPLLKIAYEMSSVDDPVELIVIINRALDISHQRSDLAELFIEGGSESLSQISGT